MVNWIMPLQLFMFKFSVPPLQFIVLKSCHYNLHSTGLMPFSTLAHTLGPVADQRTRTHLSYGRFYPRLTSTNLTRLLASDRVVHQQLGQSTPAVGAINQAELVPLAATDCRGQPGTVPHRGLQADAGEDDGEAAAETAAGEEERRTAGLFFDVCEE